MKKALILSFLMLLSLQVSAKRYPWKGLDHQPNVVQLAQGHNMARVCKACGIAGSPDKAIDQALQDAVVQVIFYGLEKGKAQSAFNPMLADGPQAYQDNKDYFDTFFKMGEFMNYVKNINSGYPSGENNVNTPEGRKVFINVEIDIKALQERLASDGFDVKAVNVGSYFK